MGSIDLLICHRWTGNVLQHGSGAVFDCNGWTLWQRCSNVEFSKSRVYVPKDSKTTYSDPDDSFCVFKVLTS